MESRQTGASYPRQPEDIARSSVQISGLTAIARIAGFSRWIVLGAAVGTTYLGNIYQTANLIPNIVFELAAGGVLSAVLVPTFISEAIAGRDRAIEVASSITNALLLGSVPLIVTGVLAGRPIMRALTAGVEDPLVRASQIELGAWFLRFFLPQIPIYLVGAVLQGLLHAHRRFVMPALAPLLSSLTVIATYLLFRFLGPGADLETVTQPQLWVLGLGTTLGVFVLTFCQLPAVLRLGIRWRPVIRLRDAGVRKALRAGLGGVAFFAITEIGLLLTIVLANRVEGGVVAFQIGYAFFELPNALIGLPLAISLFPALSKAFADHDETRFGRLLSSGWRSAIFLGPTAAAGLFVMAPVLSDAVLGWSSLAQPSLVASVARGLAIGVPAWVLVATLTRAFYARHSTTPPVIQNAVTVAVYAGLAIPLVNTIDPLLAIGVSLGAGHLAGAFAGTAMLARRAPGWRLSSSLPPLLISLVRAAAVALALLLVVSLLDEAPSPVVTFAGVAAGLAVFAVLAQRSDESRRILSLFRGSIFRRP